MLLKHLLEAIYESQHHETKKNLEYVLYFWQVVLQANTPSCHILVQQSFLVHKCKSDSIT